MKGLSQRQQQVLALLADYLRDGVPPSAARLAGELGLAGESSVTPVLQALQRKGYLRIEGGVRGRQRTITLTPRGQAEVGAPVLPVLGVIPAGPLREAIAEADAVVARVDELLPYRAGDFLLKVEGDSMTGAGILSGDRVLIRPGVAVHPGEIAAVRVLPEYDVTLKHVVVDRRRREVRLRAANPRYADLVRPADDVEIIGVMRGLVRSQARHP